MINEANQLSEREREILRLVATGLSNQQIANQLGISPNTVKVHLRNVFGKISVASRTEATMYAVRAGIVELEKADVAATPPGDGPSVLPVEASVAQPHPTLEVFTPASPTPDVAADTASPPAPSPEVADSAQSLSKPPVARREPRQAQRRWSVLWLGLALAGVLAIAAVVASARTLGFVGRAAVPTAASEASAAMDLTRWNTLPSLPGARAAFAVANIADQVFVIGGENETGVLATVERFNITFGSWTKLSAKPTPVSDVRAAVLGEKIYVPGGRTTPDAHDVTKRFERYDPRTDSWEQLPDLPAPRSAYALTQMEGKLYLFGGWDGSTYRNEVFEFDLDTNQWRERARMPTARAYTDAVVATNANIHVLGGENQDGQLATNEVYTPSREGEQPWSRRPPMPQARSRFSAAVDPVFSSIFLLGGAGTETAPLQYRSDVDRWEPLGTPPEPIGSQPGVVQQGGTILVLGGKGAEQQYSAAMQSYQAIFRIHGPVP